MTRLAPFLAEKPVVFTFRRSIPVILVVKSGIRRNSEKPKEMGLIFPERSSKTQ